MNTGEIPDTASAPGLEEARERLKLDRMTKEELNAYYRHLDNIVILRNNIYTERAEGRMEGRMEGIKEGKLETARAMKQNNIAPELIAQCTGLSLEDLKDI